MSADLLRSAAKVLREHVNSVARSSYPWTAHVEESDEELDPTITVEHLWEPTADDDAGRMLIADLSVDGGGFLYPINQAKADAAYIALMHPPVALALADWLDALHPGLLIPAHEQAVALARAILREAPDEV